MTAGVRGGARLPVLLGAALCIGGLVWLAVFLLREPLPEELPPGDVTGPVSPRASSIAPPGLADDLAERVSVGPDVSVEPAPPAAGPERPVTAWPWSACFDRSCQDRERAEEIRACLRGSLDPRPDPLRIAEYLCSDSGPAECHRLLTVEAVARIPASEALEWMDDLQRSCRRYQETPFLESCLTQIRETDLGWFLEFRNTLTPDRLFDPEADQLGVQLLALFAREGDEEARRWIQAGARGEWGGTLRQIDRAIGLSITLQQPGEEWLSNLRSIAQSAGVPEGGSIGSTFVHALLDTRAWPDGDSAPALDSLMSVLYDVRFRESAAATICLSFPAEPPAGCDPAMWEALRSRAKEIATEIGLQVPGLPR